MRLEGKNFESPNSKVRVMRFLLRMAFWLGVVLVLLPSFSGEATHKTETNTNTAGISAFDAVMFAGAAASDMRQFCERRPEACEVGSQVAVALGHRAQAGAKILYEFISEQMAQPGTDESAGGERVAAVAAKAAPVAESQNTLSASDLESAWRGPVRPAGESRSARGA